MLCEPLFLRGGKSSIYSLISKPFFDFSALAQSIEKLTLQSKIKKVF
jgi:hypothetical protein